jgi:hypothetical protein
MGPNAAGANLPDNKPRKRFNYKPNASKGFEGSSRGTFPKVPLELNIKPFDKSKFEIIITTKTKCRLYDNTWFL